MNPNKLRPSELIRVINSTEFGGVIHERRLRAQRERAGFRITDDASAATVNLFKYAAWLREQLHARQTFKPKTYGDKKAMERNRNLAIALAGRDIGELPPVADKERKIQCRCDFKKFCETYFPSTFSLPWSDDHLKVISKIETAVLRGGLFAMAMPRGSGKSSLAENAAPPVAAPIEPTSSG